MTEAKPSGTVEEPWDDPEELERLYWMEGLSKWEIADHFSCSERQVYEAFSRHAIDKRAIGSRTELSKDKDRGLEFCRLRTHPSGYVRWRHNWEGVNRSVSVHRLLAVAEYGFDAVCGMDVHHKNGVKWDNRPGNLEPMDPSEHRRLHAHENSSGERYDDASGKTMPSELRSLVDEVGENTVLSRSLADVLIAQSYGYGVHEMADMFGQSEETIRKRLRKVFNKRVDAENTLKLFDELGVQDGVVPDE